MRVKNKGRRETRRHYRKDGTMREGWKMRIKERLREILKEGENGGRKERGKERMDEKQGRRKGNYTI